MASKPKMLPGWRTPPGVAKHLYTDEGYINIEWIYNLGATFIVIVGGRGTGKTYGALKYYLERGERIIYLRRTDTQRSVAADEQFTPYKSVFNDKNLEYCIPKNKVKTIYLGNAKESDEDLIPVAYFAALSTFQNIRGFDANDCDAIVYDEFIPEKIDNRIKDEYASLLNIYESTNRNRELYNHSPVKLWLLSNSNTIDSPIIYGLGLMNVILEMAKTNVEVMLNSKRGLLVVNLRNSPISKKKENTSLYKLIGASEFKDMALSNNFSDMNPSYYSKKSLIEYLPECKIGELYIYSHKNGIDYYVTTRLNGTFNRTYNGDEVGVRKFLRAYGFLYDAYALGYMVFESLEIEYIFKKYISMN